MQTIKTGVVVALLLAVCYGAFVALNAPEPNLPLELLSEFDWTPEEAGLENLTSVEMPTTDSVTLQAPGAHDLNPSGGLGSFGASNLGLPTLPNLPAANDALPNTPGTSHFPGNGNNSNLSNIGLPSLPSLPGDRIGSDTKGGTNNLGHSNSLNLPVLSDTGGGSPSGTDSSLGADGPAVPLSPGSEVDLPNAYALGTRGESQPQPSGTTTPGQLINHSHPSASGTDPAVQLPLLDGFSKSAVAPGDSNHEQPALPFPTAREQALELASSGKLREALQLLTRYYDSPELNSEQHIDLVDLLDA
ncbi:MAG: hypothetical protein ABI557_00155, partial [Aureliella sp.]